MCGHRQASPRVAQSNGAPPITSASRGSSPALAPSARADQTERTERTDPDDISGPVATGTSPARPKPRVRTASPVAGAKQVIADGSKSGPNAQSPSAVGKPPQRAVPKPPRPKSGDEIYINQVLNNRFKVESKIGEGGFGAVYRGTQLATSRKVALKLLHPEMTKDENLVARFRREGMVLCNLRDAHTITTYDFDQTPDGTLYIAMELLEGKSLHQLFHEEAPLDWKRVFKILTEMCSSLAEAHAQGIVHRDLKPENIYLETRSGNPEFVKILDFGIAKVMRGDTIDPQAPQLTATGQTLGTLEYMSPEQLMGKPLDGRSDVYALGVLAYEMITGRLPFPDAKGPAGLITAQLKQTPQAPSLAYPKAGLPPAADRVILKCLEKDKANRYVDVSALAVALTEVMNAPAPANELAAIQQLPIPGAGRPPSTSVDMLETRRGDLPNMMPPAMPGPPASTLQNTISARPHAHAHAHAHTPQPPAPLAPPSLGLAPTQALAPSHEGSGLLNPHGAPPGAPRPPTVEAMHRELTPPPVGAPPLPPAGFPPHPHYGAQTPVPGMANPNHLPMRMQPPMPFTPPYATAPRAKASSKTLIWWVVALLVIGVGVGTAFALLVAK
ncbi:MAG TPA: protein kinase [Kofleriaceae bacterium]|nr:protein kinase [Kofleriaceae bacterium]